jgi:Animal haem peroxidase
LPCKVSDAAIDEIVAWMANPVQSRAPNPRIAAGFTYLGQFIDHDITFDPTPRREAEIDPPAVANFRTPRLDLDSVYGLGRVVHPFLYDWDKKPPGVKLLVGKNQVDSDGVVHKVVDLPRNAQGRALIGDPRNDETSIISQLHLLFIRFHNAVVDHLRDAGKVRGRDNLFNEAQKLVRWHYQWIVAHEFLPAVVGEVMARDVLPRARRSARPKVRGRFYDGRKHQFIPVEFSGAAYRFGHSMVRAEYGMKKAPAGAGLTAAIDLPPPLFPTLAGFKWLSESIVIDWEQFFTVSGAQNTPQPSQKIDTAIVDPLFELPDTARRDHSLPRRNLERGRTLGLPSGQDLAAVMHERVLEWDELELDNMPATGAELEEAAPLWYYILCETTRATGSKGRPQPGRHLGPVGGRIVAEVLAGLLEADEGSYLHSDPPWKPGVLGTGSRFTMADLVSVAQRRPA